MTKNYLAIKALALLSFVALSASSGAKERKAITVKDVTFKQTSSGWITADIEFQAGDFKASPDARKKDYLDRVKLTLTTAYEDRDLATSKNASAVENQNPYEFYQRTIELTSVKRSKNITLRFFLPPAVVESKGFPAKPFVWMLDWEVEGVKMPVDVKLFPKNFSDNLRKPDALKVFQEFLSDDANSNEGIMLPPYLGPSSLQPKNDIRDFAFVRRGDD